jgi:hypothetical protein
VLTRRATHGIPLGHSGAAKNKRELAAADILSHASCFPKIETDFRADA